MKQRKVAALPIVELVAYCIIGLASFFFAGGAIFLVALSAYQRIEDWWLERGRGGADQKLRLQ